MAERSQTLSFYDLLEVNGNATFEEIERSYHRIAAYLGPDSLATYSILDPDEGERLRAQLDEAYRTLSDPDRRAAYDRVRAQEGNYPPMVIPAQAGDSSASVGHVSGPMDQQRQSSTARDETTPRPEWKRRDTPRSTPTLPTRGNELSSRAEVDSSGEPRLPDSTLERRTQLPALQVVEAPQETKQVDVTVTQARPAATRAPAIAAARPKQRRLTLPTNIEITPDTEFSGSFLRRLREGAQASLDEVAEITKVSKRYLMAIEGNDFASLPAAVYVRGFVSEYARVLGLDAAVVAKSFMTLYSRYRAGSDAGG